MKPKQGNDEYGGERKIIMKIKSSIKSGISGFGFGTSA
jgi:hypothetical protein